MRLESLATPRRSFLGRLLAGSGALLAGSAASAAAAGTLPFNADPQDVTDEWLKKLHGNYRQVFDAVEWNGGMALVYSYNWSKSIKDTYRASDADVCAVIGLRHLAIAPAFKDEIWQKYKIGEFFKITDPKTKAPAVRNFTYNATPGDLPFPDSALSKQLAAGAVVTVCNLATTIVSGMAASAAGLNMKPEEAYAEWKAGMQPGCTLVPTGVLAIHRAQNPGGCSYCYAG